MEPAMRRTVAVGIVLAAGSLMVGCAPDTSPLDIAGIYLLTTVNGLPLPYVFPQVGTTTAEVLNDKFTLTPDGTYAETGEKRFITDGLISFTFPADAGTFTRRGTAISLESLISGSASATLQNGTLTLLDQGLTLVYQQ
jgi:hypothetical protein